MYDLHSIIITSAILCWPLFSFRVFRLMIDLIVLDIKVLETMKFLTGLLPPFLWVVVFTFGIGVLKVMLVVISSLRC